MTAHLVRAYAPEGARQRVEVVEHIFRTVFAEPPYRESDEDVAAWRADYAVQLARPGFALVTAQTGSGTRC